MTSPREAIGALFRATVDPGANYSEEVYPGYPGLVIAEGRARAMAWGFPLVLRGKQGQPLKAKAVNNAREDKLFTPFWRSSFEHRRCLIPLSAWAEAEGEKGRMTRTWYSLPGTEVFAVAGLWRQTPEWGSAYSMVMVDSATTMVDVHDRMPVILRQEEWAKWISAFPIEALAMCKTWDGPLKVDATTQSWVERSAQR